MRNRFVLRSAVWAVGIGLLGWALTACAPGLRGGARASGRADARAPVHRFGEGGKIREWLVLGPFPNAASAEPLADGSKRVGYGTDYLRDRGGEEGAILTPESTVSFLDDAGALRRAETKSLEADARGFVDLRKHFEVGDLKAAYAFAFVRCGRKTKAHAFFGSGDWAKIWVNGEEVYAKWEGEGRECRARDDHFLLGLRRGLNRVLVKVENGSGDWGFVLELQGAESGERIVAKQARERAIAAFQDAELEVKGWQQWDWRPYLLRSETFPTLGWKEPAVAKDVCGDAALRVRWFDGDLQEVESPAKPGRYAAYVECDLPDGRKVRRALTFYRPAAVEKIWGGERPIFHNVPYIGWDAIDRSVWREFDEYLGYVAMHQFTKSLLEEEHGAIRLAGLSESKPLGRKPTQLDWPETRNQDYHLALKRKLIGAEGKYGRLEPLGKKPGRPSTVLHPGTPEEAGMRADAAERIRKVCQEWWEEGGEPFSVLVARHGVVVIHEAFGGTEERPVDVETHFQTASITKTFTGFMFAQFLDQGLIGLKDPVGRYLPDFPMEGEKAITLEHCLRHASGLQGAGRWGGMRNPWLDNVIANGVETLPVGKVMIYNGMGFDLAGKVMEVVSGKSIFRLMHENLFEPLGMREPTIVDLAFGLSCAVEDLGRLGQTMLNRGSYGDLQVVSPETFERMMPSPLEESFPEMGEGSWDYGLGISWIRYWFHPDAGKNGVPKEKLALSENSIGHDGNSGSILNVDLDNDLVVTQARSSPGKEFKKYAPLYIQTVAACLED